MNNVQTHLWIGNNEDLQNKILSHIKKSLCLKISSEPCNNCRLITAKEHPNVLYISPQKNTYTYNDIDIIFKKTSLQLNQNEFFFFIINYTETLGISCSNRLLKLLEEPPYGYQFILLSNNISSILPTIRSRCLIQQFKSQISNNISPLLKHFTENFSSAYEFELELKKSLLPEQDSINLLNELFAYYCQKKDLSLSPIINHIKEAMKKTPQPGSSILFWKNLYLSFPREKIPK